MSSNEVHGAHAEPERIALPRWPAAPNQRLAGPCCACRRDDVEVRNVVCMGFRGPDSAAGKGWGCLVCAIPSHGAIAIICDACAGSGAPIVDVCADYATQPGRAEAEPLRAIPWEHIRLYHPEVPDEGDDPIDHARRVSAADLGWEMDGEDEDDS